MGWPGTSRAPISGAAGAGCGQVTSPGRKSCTGSTKSSILLPLAQRCAQEVAVDQYLVPIRNGRSLAVSAAQLGRIARGLGESDDALEREGREPPIVEALRAMPVSQRSD